MGKGKKITGEVHKMGFKSGLEDAEILGEGRDTKKIAEGKGRPKSMEIREERGEKKEKSEIARC